eukprot:scaffold15486_cov53-Attheya_sp.AAC.2
MAVHSNPVDHLNRTGEHPHQQQKHHSLNGSASKRSSSTINGINGSKTSKYFNGAGRVHTSQDSSTFYPWMMRSSSLCNSIVPAMTVEMS